MTATRAMQLLAFRRKISPVNRVILLLALVLPPEGWKLALLRQAPLFVDPRRRPASTFTHVNGATGQYYMAELMGAGVALFDYDNDGDLDVFLVQGGPLGRRRGDAPARRAGCFATT